MNFPKISIITVAYNSAATILDTINSVAAQNYPNLEYIIIDGASTDATLAIIAGCKDVPIRLVSERDRGIFDAMNKGMALASGEIVGFINSDDILAHPSVFEQVALAFQDQAIGACYADLVYVSPDNSRVVRHWKSKPFARGDFSRGWCPAHPTFYVRKSVITKFGDFDTSYKLAADAELMMRYLERGAVRVAYIPQIWVRMRLGGASNESWRTIIQQNREILAALEKNGVAYSRSEFSVRKLANRARQFVAGRLGRFQ